MKLPNKLSKKLVIIFTVLLVILIIAYFGVQSFVGGARIVEGDNIDDIVGLVYCIDDYSGTYMKINDINHADTKILFTGDCSYRSLYEQSHMVTSSSTWVLKNLYNNQNPLPHAVQFDSISRNVNTARSGELMEYNGKNAYYVSNEDKIYTVHTLVTKSAGTYYWVDTNSVLKSNVDCIDLGDRNGDNVCVDYTWIYDPEIEAPTCNAQYIGSKSCSGNNVVQSYQNTDCSMTQNIIEVCSYICSNGICIDLDIIVDPIVEEDDDEEPYTDPNTGLVINPCSEGNTRLTAQQEMVCGVPTPVSQLCNGGLWTIIPNYDVCEQKNDTINTIITICGDGDKKIETFTKDCDGTIGSINVMCVDGRWDMPYFAPLECENELDINIGLILAYLGGLILLIIGIIFGIRKLKNEI